MTRSVWLVAFMFVVPVALSAQAPQKLGWSPLALNRAHVLAQGMTNEIVLCGSVVQDGDSLNVSDLLPVYMRSTDSARARGDACPPGTAVTWHNHPWTGPGDGFEEPVDLCALGRTDRMTAIRLGTPWVAVSVGRGDPRYSWLCWWNLAQLDPLPLSLPSVEGQRLKYWSN